MRAAGDSPMPMLNRPQAQQQTRQFRPPGAPMTNPQPGGQPQMQSYTPPQAQTFAQMQAQGQARPAPPPAPMPGYGPPNGAQPYGAPPSMPAQPSAAPSQAPSSFQPPTQPYSGQLGQSIMQALQTPSGYNADQVQQSYNRLGQNIDDEYTQRERATNETYAGRGLGDSTAAAGAMHDLNVGRRTAKETLAGQLADKQAQDYAQSRQAAIGQGLQGEQQGISAGLGYGNLNLGNQQIQQQGQLANRGYDISSEQGHNQNTVQLLQLMAALGINPQQAGG